MASRVATQPRRYQRAADASHPPPTSRAMVGGPHVFPWLLSRAATSAAAASSLLISFSLLSNRNNPRYHNCYIFPVVTQPCRYSAVPRAADASSPRMPFPLLPYLHVALTLGYHYCNIKPLWPIRGHHTAPVGWR